jgi:peptidoglycan/LPS O-acetylase OafA/YrhL
VPPNRKIAEIEMLRGIAILAVLVVHGRALLCTWPMPGWDHISRYYLDFWWGVDLFFAISGFVIARTLLPQIRAAGSSTAFIHTAAAFWRRRAWRLLPAAWLWLIIGLTLSLTFNRSNIFETFHHNYVNTVAAFVFMANFRFLSVADPAGFMPSTPYWSLSLEEQFYAVLPILAFLLRRRIGLFIALAALAFFFVPEGTTMFAFRLEPILLGVLIAIAAEHPAWPALAPTPLRTHRIARALALLLPLFLMAALSCVGWAISAYRLGMIGVLAAILVYFASFDGGFLMADGPPRRVLAWIGSRSYGLYLVHPAAFMITYESWYRFAPGHMSPTTTGGHLVHFAAAFALMLVFSETTYRLVERPLRAVGRR